jgi:hypothetical protein
MERVIPAASDQNSKLLQVFERSNDEVQYAEPSQKAATTQSSPKLRLKDGGGSAKGKCSKKPTTLPNETVEYLKAWMMSPEHIAHPYPTESEKAKIMKDTGLELKQLTNWFVNNRKRYWKPRVEAHLKGQEVLTEAASSPVPFDNGDVCHSSTKQEKNGHVSSLAEEVAETPSSLRASRRKGQKGKLYIMENMEHPPFVAVTPNSHTCATNHTHMISGHNSLASQSDGSISCSDSDDERLAEKVALLPRQLTTTLYEKINLHVLRPSLTSSAVPDLSDVTVLSNVPHEGILKTHPECALTYNSIQKKNLKTNHGGLRRDAEIVRLKKRCLSMFLAEHDNTANTDTKIETDASFLSSQVTPNKVTSKRKHKVHVIPNGCNENDFTRASGNSSPRPKYRRRSIDVWKEACQTANHVYDDDKLPSLEEAARLFGYAN